MSSYGTQKPFGQQAVQLTFPTVFEEAVQGNALAYYPEMTYRPIVLHEANDIQGHYHHQKTMDAKRMAMAKVQSTINSDRYARQYHQNYNMPKPVLGQRRFANPSNGNQADIYSARQVSFDIPSSGGIMRGGVLYTQMAQKWGRQQLRNRSQQLDAIEAEKQGLPYQPPQTMELESESTKVKLEISQTLQAISASISAGQANNFAFNDSVRFLRLLFRWASSASLDELMEVMEYCEGIEEGLRELRSEGEDGNDADRQWLQQNPQLEVMMNTFSRVNNYLRGMIGGADKSVAERKRLSASLVKTLGFTRLPLAGKESPEEDAIRLEELSKRQQQRRAREVGLPSDSFDSDDDESFPSSRDSLSGISSYVSDYLRGQERNFNKARFDALERERMAQRNGSYFGEDSEGKEERETFRRDATGEAQSQGLEVGLQEPDPFAEEPEEVQRRIELARRSRSRSRSRVSSRAPSSMGDEDFLSARSRSRASSRSQKEPSSRASSRSQEEPAQPAPAPRSRSRASSRSQEEPAPRSRPPSRPPSQEEEEKEAPAPAEKKPRVLKQQRLATGGFPYVREDIENVDKTTLYKIAKRLKDENYGKYNPQSGSDEKTLRAALIKNYEAFRIYKKKK